MRKPFAYFVLFLGLLSLTGLAACAVSPQAASPEQAAAAIPFVGESLPTPLLPSPSAATPSATDLYEGIPVGFTDEGRPYRGDPNAPVRMEEFSDFQCPFCSRFTVETLPNLLIDQVTAGEVVVIYYDFPLSSIHPYAAAAANAARCAGEAGAPAFWAMHDRLYADVDAWAHEGATGAFEAMGADIGLDAETFRACLDEQRYADEIDADLAAGELRGVSSTPSFFLNDQPIVGAYPLDYFNQAIASVLAGQQIAAEPEAPTAPDVKPTPAAIIFDDIAATRGDESAPVTIVEYTDYQCPYCARHAAQTFPQLLSEMIETGRVRYIIKDFPLDSIHPDARAAAVAARCAGEQSAYWPMHDALFARQDEWAGLGAGANQAFVAMADDLGLELEAFGSCLVAGRYDDVIQANQDEGFSLGVNGTPAFFINGFPVSGAQPYELFEYAVGLAEEGTLADAYTRQEPQPTPTPSGPVVVNTDGAHSIGAADAPVVIVEFTDFQCPYCSRHFAQTFPQIKADYIDTGKVRYVFKDFPLRSIHPQAQQAAEAARCAGEQGVYLEMHNALFSRQNDWSGRSDAGEIFVQLAGEIGADTDAFSACLASGRHAAAVQADLDEGARLGVNGTPGFFLNGYLLSGAQPYSVFQQAIDSLLAEQG